MTESWPTFHDLVVANKSCRLHKPASRSQVQFETRLGENLSVLLKEIHSGRYRPSPAKCFIVTHPRLGELIQTIYSHDARIGARRTGNASSFKLILPGRSWFDQQPEQGIPIGNLSSQLGANIYLTGLDHLF
jgi:hypothetical protein